MASCRCSLLKCALCEHVVTASCTLSTYRLCQQDETGACCDTLYAQRSQHTALRPVLSCFHVTLPGSPGDATNLTNLQFHRELVTGLDGHDHQ